MIITHLKREVTHPVQFSKESGAYVRTPGFRARGEQPTLGMLERIMLAGG
jgi:hypothetical protein